MEPRETPNPERLERALASIAARPRALRLRGVVQLYAWGGHDYLPSLLGAENLSRQPWAELWIGTHPLGAATLELDGDEISLRDLIGHGPERLLGPEVVKRFSGGLPYLLKVLDVRAMLSIQAHPSRRQAEEGFARENAEGVPLLAAHRSFKDPNHKPEAQVALTEFWMLHGFRPPRAVARVLEDVPELRPLMPDFARRLAAVGAAEEAQRHLLRSLYERAMTLPQEEVDRLLEPLLARLGPRQTAGVLDRAGPDFWAARAAAAFPLPDGHRDRGIVSIYLLNLIRLAPGQGTFLGAGVPHAYLEGVTMEVMASSDNVLRGGLTPKHVDVPELLRALTFESGPPAILAGEPASATERVYRTPAEEFELSRLDVAPGRPHRAGPVYGADSLIVLEGAARLGVGGDVLALGRGQSALVPDGVAYAVESEEKAVLFKASVPRPRR